MLTALEAGLSTVSHLRRWRAGRQKSRRRHAQMIGVQEDVGRTQRWPK